MKGRRSKSIVVDTCGYNVEIDTITRKASLSHGNSSPRLPDDIFPMKVVKRVIIDGEEAREEICTVIDYYFDELENNFVLISK
jgi:hypothetical protein